MRLQIITSDALSPARHGFFTRKGGASSGIFSGLNCGVGSSDQSHAVDLNRARAMQALDLPPQALCGVHQIHSPDVVTLDTPHSPRPKADAMVTQRPGIALGILTADCMPVLFIDAQAGVIGAAHAGWRGALGGVLQNTVTAMEALGAQRDQIQAVIGPCISQAAYEVGPEFVADFTAADPEYHNFFTPGSGDRQHFDLPGFGLQQLRSAGVRAQWCDQCTFADEDRFFSYRRTTHRGEADYGRLLSAIALPQQNSPH